jgi:undecaprenyl diphosphate synthase
LNAQIAFNYGGRNEILRAVKKLCEKIQNGDVLPEKLSEEDFNKCLDTAGLPDFDLVIRTGADNRVRTSGFFPWQTVYSELCFLNVLWPDFTKNDLLKAIEWYKDINRNMGT